MDPAYLARHRGGLLARRAEELSRGLAECRLCPWNCRVDRLSGMTGVCGVGAKAEVAAWAPHFGEEPALSGTDLPRGEAQGAGNIFFGRCNLRCVYCQNWQISQRKPPSGRAVEAADLAQIMLDLQHQGCHTLGLVSPSHVAAQALQAVALAAEQGLSLPLVWNSNAYDAVDTLRALEGVVDVFLPDLKYSDDTIARDLSGAANYRERSREAVKEMFRQTGESLILDPRGLLRRGLVIRLLVLPNDLAGLRDTLRWIRSELSPLVFLSVMSQYHPANQTSERYPLLDRPLRETEYNRVLAWVEELGFQNGWIQPFENQASHYYRPDFENRQTPFPDAADFQSEKEKRS